MLDLTHKLYSQIYVAIVSTWLPSDWESCCLGGDIPCISPNTRSFVKYFMQFSIKSPVVIEFPDWDSYCSVSPQGF